ncbi:hypothetical protein T492DRAFT_1148427 [Pavlovales sp. CCMP2436]|nr:hypothetical protein T492DRAFT_1148427 [Pavlovales sp. CCMP2436]
MFRVRVGAALVLACACVLRVPPIALGTPLVHVPMEHAQAAAVEHSAAAEDGVQPAAEARAGSRALSVATGRAVARGDVYFTYVPGRAELPWLSGLGGGQQLDGRTCDVAAEPTLILRQRHALRLADELRANPHTAPATEANPRSPLSHMVYCPPGSTRSDQSGSQQHGCRVEPIEPLHAFGRHPFAEDGKGKLGGSALGPSMPLFAKLYKERCIDFDGIWGWEARPFQAEKWWDKVPTEVRHKLHFYNVPISGAGGAADVLLTIGQVARPEDFVVLKLDIDTFEVERQVVEELRTNARGTNASLLVDEFFFEYHFATPNEPTLHTYWPKRTRGGTVDDALSLMHELRAKGIRAHFWI